MDCSPSASVHEHLAPWLQDGTTNEPPVIDSIELLPDRLDSLGIRRPLVVLSREAAGTDAQRQRLGVALSTVHDEEFDRFTPNPTVEECVAAAAVARAHEADAIIALGGGTAIDIGKMAALGAADPTGLESVIRSCEPARWDVLPIIAVPTTSGTGAEATHFAAVYADGVKRSVSDPHLLPRLAVLDESYHLTMPRGLAAVTGLDALCQSLESIWAVGGTERSRGLAVAGGGLVADGLVRSVLEGDSLARRRVMIGSHLVGRAINTSKTTLSHALSYMITQVYDVPHGHAVALTLGAVAEANALVSETDCLDPGGASEVLGRVNAALDILGATPSTAVHVVRSLLTRLYLPSTLSSVGVTQEDLPGLAWAVDPVRLSNNPRRLDHTELIEILERSWVE